MKRAIAVTVLLFLVACSTHQESNAFKALEAARHLYTSLQAIAIDRQERGLIPTRVWNEQIVPLDNKIHVTLTRSYYMLRLYLSVGAQQDFDEYVRLLRLANGLLIELQTVLNQFQTEPSTPAASKVSGSGDAVPGDGWFIVETLQ